MKKIQTIIIASSIIVASTTSSFAFGSFLERATKAVEAVSSTSSGTLTAEQETIAKQLATACSHFATSKSKAYEAIGNKNEASSLATIAQTISNEKNLQNLAKYIDSETKKDVLSILSDTTITGNDSKAAILESIKSFASGVKEEVELSKELVDTAKSAKEAIANAKDVEKVTIVSNLTPLLNLAQRFPQDLQNAKETLKGYIEFAKKNGIDVSDIASDFLKK